MVKDECFVQLLRRAWLALGTARATVTVRLNWLAGASGDSSVEAKRQGTDKDI